MAHSTALTLDQFLTRYPKPQGLERFGKMNEQFWSCDLKSPVEKIWPHISDTALLNQAAGLGSMQLVEKNGKVFGTTVNMGIELAWEECPWQWEYGKAAIIERHYYKGFLKLNRVVYAIEPTEDGHSRFYAHMILTPAGVRGAILVPIVMIYLQKNIIKAAKTIDDYVSRQQKLIFSAKRVTLQPQAEARVKDIREALVQEGVSPNLVDKIINHIRTAPDDEIDRLRPKKMAREWHLEERTLLSAFLQATRKGLLKLTWDIICPHCRGVREEADSLARVPKRGRCEACNVDFDATLFNGLEVVFHVHPSIRKVDKQIYCAAQPAAKPHIKLQKSLEPGKELSLNTFLGQGRYRMRIGGRETYNLLDVENESVAREVKWGHDLVDQSLTGAYFPTLVLRNGSTDPLMFILEDNEMDQDVLRPSDLLTFQNFRDLFNAECVSADVKLEVGVQTILFTDLVGSTQFYEKEGDAAAFAEVQKHFQKTYEGMLKHDGAIVKTIGDAVMAAFIKPADALKAAVEMQEYFNGHNPDTQLRLRITLHTGSCLAVNLNDRLDYFGNTVNLTAKIQAVVGAGQVGFTQAVNDDPESMEYLRQKQLFVEDVPFEQKWSKRMMTVHRVGVS